MFILTITAFCILRTPALTSYKVRLLMLFWRLFQSIVKAANLVSVAALNRDQNCDLASGIADVGCART